MWTVDLAKFKLGVKFEWQTITSTHTFKSKRTQQRQTKTCFATIYYVDGDKLTPLKAGFYSYRPFMESVSRDVMRCKALAIALKAAGIQRPDRIKVWNTYSKLHRTLVPRDIPLDLARGIAA